MEDTAVNVTWRALRDDFGPGVVAEGRLLTGLVSFRDEVNWQTSPNIRLCDANGEDAAVFFYTSLAPQYSLDEIHLGDTIVLRAPRLHWFADRQCGVRVDSVTQIAEMRPGGLTSARRLRFAALMRRRGNEWVERREWERAAANYRAAADLLAYTLTPPSSSSQQLSRAHEADNNNDNKKEEGDEDERDGGVEQTQLRGSALSNLCLCHVQLREWHKAMAVGQEALSALPPRCAESDTSYGTLRAKLCYRVALAAEQLRDYAVALHYATEASALLRTRPDAAVGALCLRLQRAKAEDGSGWRALLRARQARTRLPGMPSGFGARTSVFAADTDIAMALRSPGYMVDVATVLASLATQDTHRVSNSSSGSSGRAMRLRPHVLYAAGGMATLTTREMHTLRHTHGVKTYLCLRLGFRPVLPYADMCGAMQCACVRVHARSEHPAVHVDASQLPSHVPVAVEVDLLRVVLPAWLYWVLSVCYLIGMHALCDYVVHWWCYTSEKTKKTPRRRFARCITDVLCTLLHDVLASAAHYPVMLVGNDRVGEAYVLTQLLHVLDTSYCDSAGLQRAVAEVLHTTPACPVVCDAPDVTLCDAGQPVRQLLLVP